MQIDLRSINDFKKIIWDYYAAHGRLFDWRGVDDPYKVFISEVMLQQTQTARVATKYPEFINQFPTFEVLAQAPLKDVLLTWQGMGYNRRGMYLQRAAQIIVQNHGGLLPNNSELLDALPGIGAATAASICAFAFNTPTVFIETNIRAVFIHHYFNGKNAIDDKDIFPLVQATLDHENPREWYYALMDYGVMLKKSLANPSRKSKHYTKQSKFEGSDRQIRGKILKILTHATEPVSQEQLLSMINKENSRVASIMAQMIWEDFLQLDKEFVSIRDKQIQ